MLLLALEISNPAAMSAADPAIAIARLRTPEDDRPEFLASLNASGATASAISRDQSPPGSPIDPASLIHRALRCAELGPREITDLAVSIGPGGYTATRTATAASAAFALATGARLHAVPTPAVAAVSMGETNERRVVVLARKRDTAHRSVFPPGSTIPTEQTVLPIAEIAAGAPDRLAADKPTLDALEANGLLHASTKTAIITLRATSIIDALPAATEVNPASLHPAYPREPEAVANWRKLHGR